MLDIQVIREHPEKVREGLLKRGKVVNLDALLDLDQQRRAQIAAVEGLKAKRNQVTADIAALRREKQSADHLIAEMQATAAKIKGLDAQVAETETQLSELLDGLPNLPDDDVLPGGKENNQVIRIWGEKPAFTHEIMDHVALAERNGLVDYERGVKLGGANFWMYTGVGALLEWGLLNYFIEAHVQDEYEFILPPHILKYEGGYAAGQFPKFADEVFHIAEKETGEQTGQFLLPTAETALINIHRDEILEEADLPKKYFAATPCYRKEVGSYRAADRGTMRGHQFNKVEMFQFTTPETSDNAHLELLNKAEKLVQGLGLHYQVTKLAAEDMSGSMAKTYDVEIWIPSLERYSEVSSVSNARAYQARRGKIRYRKTNKKIDFVHTLNASGLATSRLFVGLVEQMQRADGSITVPEVLRKWVGRDVIGLG